MQQKPVTLGQSGRSSAAISMDTGPKRMQSNVANGRAVITTKRRSIPHRSHGCTSTRPCYIELYAMETKKRLSISSTKKQITSTQETRTVRHHYILQQRMDISKLFRYLCKSFRPTSMLKTTRE